MGRHSLTRQGGSRPFVGRSSGRSRPSVRRLFGYAAGEDQPELTDKLMDPEAKAGEPDKPDEIERD